MIAASTDTIQDYTHNAQDYLFGRQESHVENEGDQPHQLRRQRPSIRRTIEQRLVGKPRGSARESMFVVQSWKRTGPQCIDAKLVRPQIEDKTYAQEDRSPNRV